MDAAQAIIPIEEVLKKASEKLDADYSSIESKIHRFPASLRGFGEDHGYIAPRLVAIGPYYHGLSELQGMEEVKQAAAYHFCRDSGQSPEEVYEKILSVAGEARGHYADAGALAGVTDAEFASMLFLDGCFLLQFIVASCDPDKRAPSFLCRIGSNAAIIIRDIMLLENQIPLLVLKALTAPGDVESLGEFIVGVGDSTLWRGVYSHVEPFVVNESYMLTSNLLGLFRFYVSGSTGEEELDLPEGLKSFPLSTSAIDLAEIGIKLTASKTAEFKDMGLTTKGLGLFGELSLAPLYLFDVTACWLVNMAAFEACVTTSSDDFTVSSYIAFFEMLMDREEDVHELRAKRLITGELTNQQTLDFFTGVSKYLSVGRRHHAILGQIEEYKQKRKLWIAIHKVIYNNFKTIVTVLSIVGVLVGIFKALFSLKQH